MENLPMHKAAVEALVAQPTFDCVHQLFPSLISAAIVYEQWAVQGTHIISHAALLVWPTTPGIRHSMWQCSWGGASRRQASHLTGVCDIRFASGVTPHLMQPHLTRQTVVLRRQYEPKV